MGNRNGGSRASAETRMLEVPEWARARRHESGAGLTATVREARHYAKEEIDLWIRFTVDRVIAGCERCAVLSERPPPSAAPID